MPEPEIAYPWEKAREIVTLLSRVLKLNCKCSCYRKFILKLVPNPKLP